MKTPLLFETDKSGPSAREKLTAFKQEHGIKTHRAPHMQRSEHPWLAIIPFTDDKDKDIGTIMAESCRLYEESGYCATGEGELSAVRTLCKQRRIECHL